MFCEGLGFCDVIYEVALRRGFRIGQSKEGSWMGCLVWGNLTYVYRVNSTNSLFWVRVGDR